MAEAKQGPSWQAESIPTGVPNLDRLIDGGLTRGSLVLLAGGPGAGKTVLAGQMAFHWAAQGRKVLWVVTLGEPNEKFMTHLSAMRFFDRRMVGDTVQIINLSRYLEQGRQAQLSVIRETVQGGDYAFVIIDGFQSQRSFLGDPRDVRLFLSELGSELALMGITMLLTVDASPLRNWESAEFTVVDVIIALERGEAEGRERRLLRVLKQRGRAAIGGHHTFTISSNGIHVHPRVEAVARAAEAPASTTRHSFGLAGLDQMLAGGLLEGSATLLAGSAGTGKSLLAGQFLAEGLRQGQPGLYLAFFESLNRLLQRAGEFDMPLRQGLESGLLHVKLYPSGRCDPDACAEEAMRLIAEHRIRRLVLDGLEPIERELATSGRIIDYLAAVVEYLRAQGVTSLLTYELSEPVGTTLNLGRPLLSQVTGNVIFLRFARTDTRRHRLLSVLKTRYSDHSDAIAELLVSQGRLEVVTDPAAVQQQKPDLVPVAFQGEPQGGHYY